MSSKCMVFFFISDAISCHRLDFSVGHTGLLKKSPQTPGLIIYSVRKLLMILKIHGRQNMVSSQCKCSLRIFVKSALKSKKSILLSLTHWS